MVYRWNLKSDSHCRSCFLYMLGVVLFVLQNIHRNDVIYSDMYITKHENPSMCLISAKLVFSLEYGAEDDLQDDLQAQRSSL